MVGQMESTQAMPRASGATRKSEAGQRDEERRRQRSQETTSQK